MPSIEADKFVVGQTLDYVNSILITKPPDMELVNSYVLKSLGGDKGYGYNRQRRLSSTQPHNGRQLRIVEDIGPYTVTLVHPNRSILVNDLGIKTHKKLPELEIQEEHGGQQIQPADLIVGLRDRVAGDESHYLIANDTIYAVSDRQIIGFEESSPNILYVHYQDPLILVDLMQKATDIRSRKIRGVKRDRWTMQELMDQGVTGKALRRAEEHLLVSLTHKANDAPVPPETTPLFPDAERIGYGWEWIAYSKQGGASVAKVPRGVFPEVNEPRYLDDAKDIYSACMAFIPLFTAPTFFDRINETNVIFQPQLHGSPVKKIRPESLTSYQRGGYREFGEGLMEMLEMHTWLPDLWIEQTRDGTWYMRDVLFENETPTLYDFTGVYDIFRLDPRRTRREKERKGNQLYTFIEDMS